MLRIITLNLNGIRSAWSKGVYPWLLEQNADIVCLQELKAQHDDLESAMKSPTGFHAYYHFAEKKGYSGVGIWSKQEPDQIVRGLGSIDHNQFTVLENDADLAACQEADSQGRYLRADFGPRSVVSLYLPSGSSSPERQAAKFRFMELFYAHLGNLAHSGRQVLVCGDWNIAHQEIDLKNWKSNRKNSGFLPEERAWIEQLLSKGEWQDAYRQLYPTATDACYTWWSNRGQAWVKNVGWRLDYQLTTPDLSQQVIAAEVYKGQRFSDHAPLTIDYQT